MSSISSLCVFCGSKMGNDEVYANAAIELATEMAKRKIELIYGAGNIGLMGVVAETVSNQGGKVSGVIPQFLLDMEVGRRDIDRFFVTDSMHDRKAKMFEMSDAFVTLPGGLGSLDETFEIITWKQLGLHNKPIIILDVAGYWEPLSTLIASTIENGFASEACYDLYSVVDSVAGVFDAIDAAPKNTEASNVAML